MKGGMKAAPVEMATEVKETSQTAAEKDAQIKEKFAAMKAGAKKVADEKMAAVFAEAEKELEATSKTEDPFADIDAILEPDPNIVASGKWNSFDPRKPGEYLQRQRLKSKLNTGINADVSADESFKNLSEFVESL